MRKVGDHDHPEPQSVDMLRKLGYESSDVSLNVLVKWIGFLFIFIGGTSLVTYLIYIVFIPSTPINQSSGPTVGKLPKEAPALQSHPKIDMRLFREQEEARVDGYGWVDKDKGIAHVPIHVAMEEIIASGSLPKAEPGAGKIEPARGEDVTGVPVRGDNPPGSQVPGMPNAAVPGPQNQGPETVPPGGTLPR